MVLGALRCVGRAVVACAILASCGRDHSGQRGDDASTGSDARLETDGAGRDSADASGASDGAVDGGSGSGAIVYVGGLANHALTSATTSDSFTIKAQSTMDTIVLHIVCGGGNALPTGASVTAPGWAFTQASNITTNTTIKLSTTSFFALAPNTNPVTVTVSWAITNCKTGVSEVADEFARFPPGPLIVEARQQAVTTATCADAMLATGRADETLWAACFAQSGAVTAVSGAFTRSAATPLTGPHWAAYKVTTDPAGTSEPVSFTGGAGGFAYEAIGLAPN
jgi:hypothetical protein